MYRIVGRIGDGGMGSAADAMHPRLQTRAAVEVMAREPAAGAAEPPEPAKSRGTGKRRLINEPRP
jgi:hypothetical protein